MTWPTGVRQVVTFVVLLVRHFRRSGMAGSRVERFRKGSAFIFRLAMLLVYANIGRALGAQSLQKAALGIVPVEWLVAGLLGFSASWGALARTPALRGMSLPLASPFIDTLPVHDGARTLVELFEIGVVHVVVAMAFVTAAPALSLPAAAGLGLLSSLTAASCGAAVSRWIGVLLPPRLSISLAQVLTGVQATFALLAFEAPHFATWVGPIRLLAPLSRPIAEGRGVGAAIGWCAAAFAIAMCFQWLAERVGYDRTEVGPAKRFAVASGAELTIGAVDEVLAHREPGGRRWPFVLFGALALGAVAALLLSAPGEGATRLWDSFATWFVLWVAWMSIPMAAGVASRAVTRDLNARPFLAALPIEPRELLAGKVSIVRQRLLIGLFPLLFALLAPLPDRVLVEVGWRTIAVVCAAWIYGSAAVSVAFLVGGVQNARPQPGGTFRLESILLLVPLGSVLAARSPWTALVPIGALGLVAFEARRAATRVARWLDDGEDFERETPEWRAALAFGAFIGAQALVSQLAAAFIADPGEGVGTSYVVSAVLLALLTLHGRRDLAPLVLWPKNRLWIVAGLGGGAATAAFARFYAHHLLGGEHQLVAPEAGGAVGPILLVVCICVFAPVVEELFFRAWLQHVVERDLNDGRRWMAPVIVALAFATAHPAVSFPAVFPVGLIAGALYFRTSALAPCIAAHAAHNVLVTLFR